MCRHKPKMARPPVWTVIEKNDFWLVATQKRELESNQTIFEICVLNPFHGQKIKENVFPTWSLKLNLSASSKTGILFFIPWWLQNILTLRKLQPFRFGCRALNSVTSSSYVCFCSIRNRQTKSLSKTKVHEFTVSIVNSVVVFYTCIATVSP